MPRSKNVRVDARWPQKEQNKKQEETEATENAALALFSRVRTRIWRFGDLPDATDTLADSG